MRRFMARLWIHFNNHAEFCWPHTEPFCRVCERKRVEKERVDREVVRLRFRRKLALARGKNV